MKRAFREALIYGEGHRFNYKGRRYQVLDNVLIFDIDSEDTYILYVDF